MNIKIKNMQVRDFSEFLHGLNIKGAKTSRMRTRILRHTGSYLTDKLIPELNVIIKKYAELDEKDNPMTGAYGIEWKPEFYEKAIEEMQEVDNEYYYLECDEYMKPAIIAIGEFLLENEDIELSGNVASFFDEWCEEFEKAIAFYAKKEVEKEE